MLAPMTRAASALNRAFLDLLFPPRCVSCQRVGTWLCALCQMAIETIPPPVCARCGRQLSEPTCPICAYAPPQIDGIRAMAFFEPPMRDAIHAFKYEQRPELALPLGAMLADYFARHAYPADAIIPVPLHPERERARGYNQAALLARAFARDSHLPLWERALTRTRFTQPQVELDARQRRVNVHDAFAADTRVTEKRILLIDDVCTTGATMEACSIALRRRGARAVWGLALARPRFADDRPTKQPS